MAEDQDKPSPSYLRQLILNDLKEPVVFRGMISDWKLLAWDLKKWASLLGDKLMPFRSGVRESTSAPQWERNCQVTHLKMKEFISLAEHTDIDSSKNTRNWFYFDYKYMNVWFKDNPDFKNVVSWEAFGFPEQSGDQSTIWIGSDGAHTPCHFDTYGCNLVAQVFGSKQWILFPPQDTSSLLPTRVPYEESSVYSKHNFFCPDSNVANGLHKAWIITLNPGEVLFVPHHWWHYVENIGTAISINTWLPLPSDRENRLQECLVRLIVSQLAKEVPDKKSIFNPNEDDISGCSLQENVTLLETCMQQFYDQQLEVESSCSKPKRIRISQHGSDFSSGKTSISVYEKFIKALPTYSEEMLQHFLAAKRDRFKSSNESETPSNTSAVAKVINALCHPDVISEVKSKLCEEFCRNNS